TFRDPTLSLHDALPIFEGAREAGLEAREFDLSDVPLYNADVEALGFPPSVEALRRAVTEAAALIIATPEYNNSIPGVLKNAIDRSEGTRLNSSHVAISY